MYSYQMTAINVRRRRTPARAYSGERVRRSFYPRNTPRAAQLLMDAACFPLYWDQQPLTFTRLRPRRLCRSVVPRPPGHQIRGTAVGYGHPHPRPFTVTGVTRSGQKKAADAEPETFRHSCEVQIEGGESFGDQEASMSWRRKVGAGGQLWEGAAGGGGGVVLQEFDVLTSPPCSVSEFNPRK